MIILKQYYLQIQYVYNENARAKIQTNLSEKTVDQESHIFKNKRNR